VTLAKERLLLERTVAETTILLESKVSLLVRSRLSASQYANYQQYLDETETVFRLTALLGRRLARLFNSEMHPNSLTGRSDTTVKRLHFHCKKMLFNDTLS